MEGEHAGYPLLCAPAAKPEREAANAVLQLQYLTYLVKECGIRSVRESHLLELQKLAVDGIYPCGGRLRDAKFTVEISDGVHHPPQASLVPELVQQLVGWCNNPSFDALQRAAFALWRINWIHPFAGGNGRTARALSYLIFCMDAGTMLPGVQTMPGLIAKTRDGYIDALRQVDAGLAAAAKSLDGGTTTLPEGADFIQPMADYLGNLMLRQLRSAQE